MSDKFFIVHFKFNWEVLMWYEGIKNATELSYMIARSRSKQIKYDISKIYKLYNNQHDEIILKEIVKFTNSLLNISLTRDFIKKFL